MKRLIFTLSFIIAAGLISTAYSQVSIHANVNLGRASVRYNQAPVAYAPACAPAPVTYYDNGYNRDRFDVVIGTPGRDRRSYDRYEDRRDFRDRDYRDRDYRDRDNHDRDHRDNDHGRDGRRY